MCADFAGIWVSAVETIQKVPRTVQCLLNGLVDKGCTTDSSLSKDLRASTALYCATETSHNTNLLFFK